jgi:subtilase family serine protease
MNRIVILLIASTMLFLGIAGVVTASQASVQTGSNDLNGANLISVPLSISHSVPFGDNYGLVQTHLNQRISVMVTLQFSNESLLKSFLSGLNNRNSPYYHRYLSASQFDRYFSPSRSLYDRAVNYYIKDGFSVKTYSDRVSFVLKGSIDQFQQAMDTNIATFQGSARSYIAPVGGVYLPSFLAGNVVNIAGLNTKHVATVNFAASPDFTTGSSGQLLYGSDFQNAYQISKMYQSAGYPTNETIATILWSGTNSAGQSVAPFVPSDIYSYYNKTIPSGEPHSSVYGAPIDGAPAPGPSAANDQSQADFESTLDLEMAGSTAPGANIVEVYGPQATQSCLDQAFAFILNPNSSYPQLNSVVAISNSWGGSDMTDSSWTSYEQEAAARGITVFASSGDDGNTGNVSPSFPATASYNTYGITAVGGICTTLAGTASTTGTGTTGIQTESVWYNTPNSGDGSQGGVSTVYAEPSWQQDSSDANSVITGASSITGVSSGRGTPDVGADGANMEIWITYSGSTGYQELWGTSIASPLTAGLFATLDYYVGHKVGFIDPFLYQLGQAQYNGTLSSPAFYFVANGSNGEFSAAKGYNLIDGWGSINAYNFAQYYINGIPTATSSPPPTQPTSTQSNGIFSQVNATTSNIQLYSVPEAEEFTVNSTYTANNVVLYLSGSGTIDVSIGTSVFGSQILANQSYSIGSSAGWYQLFFSNISLTSSTDYFLNVYLASGSTEWGYTTSASVDQGAIQDYWYSGSTLVNDNSYPDIYSIGYFARSTATSSPPPTSSTPTGVFVEVDASSSNIYTYSVPEAEEFTVSSSVQVNFLVLYLSGAGSIDVSIGTSLFGSQVMANQTFTIGSTAGFYNFTIPTTTLNSGTDYYINVYDAAGSTTEWGYTSSPSIDNGAVQDYWYSGSTLENDNSYPDIFSLGYA